MIRRPPRSTLDRSSAASDVYKRQAFRQEHMTVYVVGGIVRDLLLGRRPAHYDLDLVAVSYTHLRAHETVLALVCRLLLEQTNISNIYNSSTLFIIHATVNLTNYPNSTFSSIC